MQTFTKPITAKLAGHSMSPLVNLNARSFDDEPRGPVTEADLLRAIAAGANSDNDGYGWGDFSETLPIPLLPLSSSTDDLNRPQPQPAEASTEIGAEPDTPAVPHGLAWLFDAYPRTAMIALLSFLLICMGLADTNEAEAAHEEAQQQQQEQHAAAHEAQP